MALNLLGGMGRQPKSLVEFRAGKMTQSGNMVNPDKRKGLVYIYQSDDGLIHFSWKDRSTGVVEDDLIVFPEDTIYQKVNQCKDGSRVFMLKFKASSRKLFFWMQEPKTEADEDYVRSVNDALNGKLASDSSNIASSASEQDMQNLLGSMSQSQLMQLLGGMSEMGGGPGLLAQLNQLAPGLASMGGGSSSGGTATDAGPSSTGSGGSKPQSLLKVKKPSTAPAAAKAPPPASSAPGPIQLEDLSTILNRIQSTSTGGVQVDLTQGVNAEVIRRITSSESTVKKLIPLLPQFGGPDTTEASVVEETLKSPQFQSALSAFCAAFSTGSLGPLISQFGFQAEAVTAANNGNLEAFINAIQKETTTSPADVVEDMHVD